MSSFVVALLLALGSVASCNQTQRVITFTSDHWNVPGRSDGLNCGLLKSDYKSAVEIRKTAIDLPLAGPIAVAGENAISYIVGSRLISCDLAGNVLWSRPIGISDPHRSPAVSSQGVFVPQPNGTVSNFGLDGVKKWEIKLVSRDEQLLLSPVMSLHEGIVIPSSKELHCLNSDGTIRWQVELPEIVASDATVSDEVGIIVIAGSRTVVCIDGSDGHWKWTTRLDAKFTVQRAIVIENTVWVGDSLGNVFQLSDAGEVLQQWNVGSGIRAMTVVSGDGVVCLTQHSLHAFENDDIVWDYRTDQLLCDVLGSCKSSSLIVGALNEIFGLTIPESEKAWSIVVEDFGPFGSLTPLTNGAVIVHDAKGGLLLIE